MSDELKQAATGLLDQYPWLTYWWVLVLAGWGGIVSYLRKVRSGEVSRFSLTELIGELVTSGFAGLLTFLACRSAGIDELMTGVLVGISGHMGARGIFAAEKLAEKWAARRFGIDDRKRGDGE
ncbi:MAG: phage holin family protein [Guyparkeria sp.]